MLLITLNVNSLNAPVKMKRLSDWIKMQDPMMYRL